MAAELPPVIDAAQRFRLRLIAQDARTARRMIAAYGRAYLRLLPMIERLQIALIEAGPEAATLLRQRAALLESLLDSIRAELGRFSAIALDAVDATTRLAVALALRDSAELIQLATPFAIRTEVRGVMQRLNPDAVETIVGFLAEGSSLRKNLDALGPEVANVVEEKLTEAIVLGFNPRTTARLIRKAAGQGLTWALNATRTAQMYAYREATRANYIANSHVVTGWIWFAQLDDRVCLSCLSQHGSEHTLDEVLNDHHSGRCAMIPKTVSMRHIGVNIDDEPLQVRRGDEWFSGLSEAEQRRMMGPSMYAAWQDGAFQFRELSTPYTDSVYGEMLREASLVGLLGKRAEDYYRRV